MKYLSPFICCGKAFGCTFKQLWWCRGGQNLKNWWSGGANTTLWYHCWDCKPPHSALHIHYTCIWSVWAPSYAVEWHLGAPLLLEESARSYSEARIRPLTHVSVDRAYQAESVGSKFSLVILFAIRRSPIYEWKSCGEIASVWKIRFNFKKRISS